MYLYPTYRRGKGKVRYAYWRLCDSYRDLTRPGHRYSTSCSPRNPSHPRPRTCRMSPFTLNNAPRQRLKSPRFVKRCASRMCLTNPKNLCGHKFKLKKKNLLMMMELRNLPPAMWVNEKVPSLFFEIQYLVEIRVFFEKLVCNVSYMTSKCFKSIVFTLQYFCCAFLATRQIKVQ